MFESTTTENFQSWDKFLSAYYEPIKTAMGLMPFVGADRADDVAHNFFLKLYERDLLANRPAITGRFRDWLYVAAATTQSTNRGRSSGVASGPTRSRASSRPTRARAAPRMPRSTPTSATR